VCPNFSQTKVVLQIYLTQHNIPFSATDTKKVLYEKIKQKKTPVVYKTGVPACKTIKRLPLPEGIFGASDPSFGSHI
jgi:hypothetical protein